MVLAHIKCQGYDDMLNHFRSPLPPNYEKLAAKKKKKAPGKRVSEEVALQRLSKKRPRDLRLSIAGHTEGPRARRPPRRFIE